MGQVVWRTQDDGRVRAAHQAMAGQTVTAGPNGQLPVWTVADAPCHYPGDPQSLPPGDRIGCRCYAENTRSDNSATQRDVAQVVDGRLQLVRLPPTTAGSRTPRALTAPESVLLRDDIPHVSYVTQTNDLLAGGELTQGEKDRVTALDGTIADHGQLVADTVMWTPADTGQSVGYLILSATERPGWHPIALDGLSVVAMADGLFAGPRALILEPGNAALRVAGTGALTASGAPLRLSCAPNQEARMDDNASTAGTATLEAPVQPDPAAAPTATQPDDAGRPFDWAGPLVLENTQTGDGRMIAPGALTWRDLPLPLMLMTENGPGGHQGAKFAGTINQIERDGDQIIGHGYFDTSDVGQEAQRLVNDHMMNGVSADMDMTQVEYRDPGNPDQAYEGDIFDLLMNGVEPLLYFTAGRVMGASMCPFPAMQEAHIDPVTDQQPALVASGTATSYAVSGHWFRWSGPFGGDALTALVASGAPVSSIPLHPAAAAFERRQPSVVGPVQIDELGQIEGYVALWGTCHIGFQDRCVSVPKSMSNYAMFRTGQTITAEGTVVPTGTLYLDGGHAPLNLGAQGAKDWMADTAFGAADVVPFEDEIGIFIRGALRSDITPEQLRALRGSDLSPDWRAIGRNLEMVALAAVNTSGFIVPALVASGAVMPRGVGGSIDLITDQVTSLVGAGKLRHDDGIGARLAAVESFMRDQRAERARTRLSARHLPARMFETVPEYAEVPGMDGQPVKVLTGYTSVELSGGNCAPSGLVDGPIPANLVDYPIDALACECTDVCDCHDDLTIEGFAGQLATSVKKTVDGKTTYVLPDGSYPISDTKSLESAIRLRGKSKTNSKADVEAHIRYAAGKLKLTDNPMYLKMLKG